MRTKHAFRPNVEALEGRWVPATIRLVSGTLLVSNPNGTGTLSVTIPAPGQATIKDGTSSAVTVSGVGSLISITGSDAANTIEFKADAAAFGGNVLINGQNGNDTINIEATAVGGIGGDLQVSGGLGNDTVAFTAATRVGGNVNLTDTAGANTLTQTGALTVGKDLSVNGAGTVTQGAALTVGGSATFNATQTVANVLNVTLSQATTIGKSLSVLGGVLNDTFATTNSLTVGGSTTLNLGGGNNTFTLTPTAGSFNGPLTATGGAGNDTVTTSATLITQGNATFNLGDGTNSFTDAVGAQYFGDLNITGGAGNDTVTVNGAVSGNLALSYGNGTNTVTLNGSVGGTFRYRGGNGTNTVILTPATPQVIVIDAIFGTNSAAGSNTLNLGANVTLTGIVIGQPGAGNSFSQGTAVLLPNLIFINFP